VALANLDDEHDVAALGAAREAQAHVVEPAGAQQAPADRLDARVLDVHHFAGPKRDVAADDAPVGAAVAAHLDPLEDIADRRAAALARLGLVRLGFDRL